MKPTKAIIGVVIAMVGLWACGSSSSSSSTTTTTTPQSAVCSAKTDLQSSIKALADPSLITEGKSAISAAMDTVKQDLDTLGTAEKANLKPEVDAVKNSIDQLKTAVGNLGEGAAGSGLTAVGNAISDVSTSTTKLFDAITTKCPSS